MRLNVYRAFCVLFLVSLSSNLAAGWELMQECDYRNGNLPEAWNGLNLSVIKERSAPVGGIIIQAECKYNRDDLRYPSFFIIKSPMEKLKNARQVRISFYVKGKKGNKIGLRVTANAPESTHFTDTLKCEMTGEWQKVDFKQKLRETNGEYVNIPRMLFLKFDAGDKFYFSPIKIETNQKGDK